MAVAVSSGAQPWLDAASGAFTPPDITQDVAAARLFANRVSPYGPDIREMHYRLTGIPTSETFPYFPHPPFSLVVSLFTAFVPLQTARLLWFALSVSLVSMLAALLGEHLPAGSSGRGSDRRARQVVGLFVLLLLWPPVLYNLEKGQWSILLAVLVALGWRALSRHRSLEGGVWIGLAAAVKAFPVLLGGYLLLRWRRAFIWFLAAGALATSLPLLWIGFEALPAFVRQSQLNMPYWETWPAVVYSLHGAVARLLIGGSWADAAWHAPALALGIEIVAALVLLWIAVRACTGRGRSPEDSAAFAAWIVLLPVLNPQSMGHNGVLLALPIVLLAIILPTDRRIWIKAAWVLGVVLVSIPRQTILRMAPAPVEPWKGVAITALPMWGALLLFAAAVAASGKMIGHPSSARTDRDRR